MGKAVRGSTILEKVRNLEDRLNDIEDQITLCLNYLEQMTIRLENLEGKKEGKKE